MFRLIKKFLKEKNFKVQSIEKKIKRKKLKGKKNIKTFRV